MGIPPASFFLPLTRTQGRLNGEQEMKTEYRVRIGMCATATVRASGIRGEWPMPVCGEERRRRLDHDSAGNKKRTWLFLKRVPRRLLECPALLNPVVVVVVVCARLDHELLGVRSFSHMCNVM